LTTAFKQAAPFRGEPRRNEVSLSDSLPWGSILWILGWAIPIVYFEVSGYLKGKVGADHPSVQVREVLATQAEIDAIKLAGIGVIFFVGGAVSLATSILIWVIYSTPEPLIPLFIGLLGEYAGLVVALRARDAARKNPRVATAIGKLFEGETLPPATPLVVPPININLTIEQPREKPTKQADPPASEEGYG
jgi:hypothetical protein